MSPLCCLACKQLLQALVACAGVTLGAVATAIGVELRDASRYCVVYQTLQRGPDLQVSYARGGEDPSTAAVFSGTGSSAR